MRRQAFLAIFLILAVALSVVLVPELSWRSDRRKDHTCFVNMIFIQSALNAYGEKNGSPPFDPAKSPSDLVSEILEDVPIRRRCELSARDDEDDGYRWVFRPLEEWERLWSSGLGTRSYALKGWPVVWCRDSPHGGSNGGSKGGSSYAATAFAPGIGQDTSLSALELSQLTRLADGLASPGELATRLASGGFFEWGFQRRVEPLLRAGLERLKLAKLNSVGLAMVPVPGGPDGSPAPFWCSFSPVTSSAWAAYERATGDFRRELTSEWAGKLSVLDAGSFCEWLTGRERTSGAISPDEVYRLPTEAEWEHLALGGKEGPYPTGSDYPAEDEPAVYPYSYINPYGVLAWVRVHEFCLLGGPEGDYVLKSSLASIRDIATGRPPPIKTRSVSHGLGGSNVTFRVVLSRKTSEAGK